MGSLAEIAKHDPAWWNGPVGLFMLTDTNRIIGDLAARAGVEGLEVTPEQIDAWRQSCELLRAGLKELIGNDPSANAWHVFFEFTIPRRLTRPDVVLLVKDRVLVIEFKIGSNRFSRKDQFQTCDYGKDLRDFHEGSRNLRVVPLLVASAARDFRIVENLDARLEDCHLANAVELGFVLAHLVENTSHLAQCDGTSWMNSRFAPTPDIIAAARHIYLTHSVEEINHHRANNLDLTISVIQEIVADSQTKKKNNICFVTGEPGSGKTLVGLGATHAVAENSNGEIHGTYLSGNLPLVKVLRYAIALDHSHRENVSLAEAERRTSTFIQPAYAFFGELHNNNSKPSESVLIFDEAQRAWDAKHNEQNSKHGVRVSEAESTLSIMERLEGGATVVALIGTGQEINRGEAGIKEWIKALEEHPEWGIFAPSLGDYSEIIKSRIQVRPSLNLPKSIREVRARGLSEWVDFLLAGDFAAAAERSRDLGDFPLFQTRSLAEAKRFLRDRASVDRRTGLIASSQDRRMRAFGIERSTQFLRSINFSKWFVHDELDVRSSYALEVAASEFECQGLEIDWVGMCWGSDLLWKNSKWLARRFKGTKWQVDSDSALALNRYRVLLTRARYGMIIWIPSDPNSEIPFVNNSDLDRVSEVLLSAGVQFLASGEPEFGA
jgi:hypothetical protein